MPLDFKVDIIDAKDVARLFGTSPPKIKAAILNGTLPIGFVADDSGKGGFDRTIIVEQRLKKWLNGDDLSGKVVLK